MFGKKAVQFALDYKPDLILLDLDLPDIHGSEVLKLLRAEPDTEAIPVIILSADAMTKQVRVPQPVFDAVRKQFNERELVELTATIGGYNLVSRFLEAMQIDHEEHA